jgi:hypothetical protein
MYAGAGSRMLWSGAFAAIGFGSFEAVKGLLGVSDQRVLKLQAEKADLSYNRPERELQHALTTPSSTSPSQVNSAK